MTVYLSGLGAYLPHRVVSNDTLAAITGLDADFIRERTGVTQRHLARAGVGTAHMATVAGREALLRSGVAPEEVGFVGVVSSFHNRVPRLPTAEVVRLKLGLGRAAAVDIGSPLTGFITAIQLGYALVEGGGGPALIIGAEGFSNATGLKDRRTCYLFSDGAGAVVLTSAGGLARLGTVFNGALEAPKDADDRWECSLSTRPGQGTPWRGFAAALDQLEGRFRTLHVPAQRSLSRPETADDIPENVKIHRPLADTGDLLAASLPLSLYHFFHAGSYREGEAVLAFSTDGLTKWNACLLDEVNGIARSWDDLSMEQERELARGRWRDTTERERATCSPEELRARLLAAAADGARSEVGMACITFQLSLSDPIESGSDEQAIAATLREVVRLLLGQVRATDELYQLDDRLRYVVLLRYIEEGSARSLARRLHGLVESVDPASQLRVAAEVDVVHFSGDAPADFADTALRALGVA